MVPRSQYVCLFLKILCATGHVVELFADLPSLTSGLL
jgi:hypothetical protein